jgi:hypothetical protein
MNARIRQHAAWSSLVCCVLSQCVAGVWHIHVHPQDAACATVAHEPEAGGCCHSHGCSPKADDAHQHGAPAAPSKDTHHEHDCPVCQYLAARWMAAPLVSEIPRSELVALYLPATPENPGQPLLLAHYSRGPPAA